MGAGERLNGIWGEMKKRIGCGGEETTRVWGRSDQG